MAKADLQREIRALLAKADASMQLAPLLTELCELLARHPDALCAINSRYRLTATDTGVTRAFALEGGMYRSLADTEPVDVTVSGKEGDLLRVFRRELSPMAALLRGKIKVSGSKGALMQFAEFL